MSKSVSKYLHTEMDKEAGKRHMGHRTKIVATVGPACDTYDKLLELVRAGVNVFRLNFSHGAHEDKAAIIEHIRNINKNEPYNIAILGDLQGPKLRVGEMEGGGIEVSEGDVLTFKVSGYSDRTALYLNSREDYNSLIEKFNPNDNIKIIYNDKGGVAADGYNLHIYQIEFGDETLIHYEKKTSTDKKVGKILYLVGLVFGLPIIYLYRQKKKKSSR